MDTLKKIDLTPIPELARQVENHLAAKSYSPKSLLRLRRIWGHFARYASDSPFSLEMGAQFLRDAYGLEWSEFPAPMRKHQRRCLSAIRHLRDYEQTGEIGIHRPMKKSYEWPKQFNNAVNLFVEGSEAAGYSKDHMRGKIREIHNFTIYLSSREVKNCSEINISHVMDYIRERCGHLTVGTLKTRVAMVRSFLKFLYLNELNPCDISALIPPIRQFKLSQLPVVWKKDGIIAMLEAIDRNTAEGKRDYAIFMLAVNLGLRIGDILQLQFQNIDWTKAVIQVSQAKTNELLSLPMSNEIGWALIEYIKEGRPQSDEPYVFVRHCAPFQAFCINNNFHYQIRKYAALAGIQPPSSKLYGMHSLRHTFATSLLKEGSQLPLISELLGHNGVSSAPIYLKVDDEQLRLCALDPEIEVSGDE